MGGPFAMLCVLLLDELDIFRPLWTSKMRETSDRETLGAIEHDGQVQPRSVLTTLLNIRNNRYGLY
jgi:hypothetical protein